MHTANISLSPALIAKMVRCIEDAVGDDIRRKGDVGRS